MDTHSLPLPADADVKAWYQQNVNAGLFSLLSFMGLDTAEVQAEGWLVRTGDGREFIDLVGGYGSYNFGHRHPRIVAAVQEQLARMALSSKLLLNPVLAGLAHDLAEIAPAGLSKTFVSNSGTEAVEAALKLARLATGKPGFVTTTNAYHGKTLGSLSGTHRDSYQQPFRPLMQYFVEAPYGDSAAIEAAIGEDTAAVMLEPVQGEGGIIVPPDGYLRELREITGRRGVLLILDEVQTGMGRTGRNFACEREGVTPDMLVLAKSLGGGVMPIGATMGTEAVWKNFESSPLVHTSTFGGNEMACAAARAAIRVLVEEDIAGQAAASGAHMLAGLRALAADFPQLITAVRGAGLMIGLDTPSADIAQLFIANVLEQQVLVAFALNKPGVIRIEPPLTISLEAIDSALASLRIAAEATLAIGEQYGVFERQEVSA